MESETSDMVCTPGTDGRLLCRSAPEAVTSGSWLTPRLREALSVLTAFAVITSAGVSIVRVARER